MRLRRGLYTSVPLEVVHAREWVEDPWVVASKLYGTSSYIGGWSANSKTPPDRTDSAQTKGESTLARPVPQTRLLLVPNQRTGADGVPVVALVEVQHRHLRDRPRDQPRLCRVWKLEGSDGLGSDRTVRFQGYEVGLSNSGDATLVHGQHRFLQDIGKDALALQNEVDPAPARMARAQRGQPGPGEGPLKPARMGVRRAVPVVGQMGEVDTPSQPLQQGQGMDDEASLRFAAGHQGEYIAQ